MNKNLNLVPQTLVTEKTRKKNPDANQLINYWTKFEEE